MALIFILSHNVNHFRDLVQYPSENQAIFVHCSGHWFRVGNFATKSFENFFLVGLRLHGCGRILSDHIMSTQTTLRDIPVCFCPPPNSQTEEGGAKKKLHSACKNNLVDQFHNCTKMSWMMKWTFFWTKQKTEHLCRRLNHWIADLWI